MTAYDKSRKQSSYGCWRCGGTGSSERQHIGGFVAHLCAACVNLMREEAGNDPDIVEAHRAGAVYQAAINRGDEQAALDALHEMSAVNDRCFYKLKAMFEEYGRALDVIAVLEEQDKYDEARAARENLPNVAKQKRVKAVLHTSNDQP